MSKSDIIVTFLTIVYGILLTNLFSNIHKLIRKRTAVKWHWLPLLVTWFLLLVIFKNWWGLVFIQDDLEWLNIFFLIAYGHFLVLLFLLVSAALPDKIPENGINLKTYYFQIHTYFWGLKSAVLLFSFLISVFQAMHMGVPHNIFYILLMIKFILLAILLAINKKVWVHSVGLIYFVIAIIAEIISMSAL